jgi:Retinoblastoma-associated protein B domain
MPARKQVYTVVSHVVYSATRLLYGRHLDQILLSALYGVGKVHQLRAVSFKEIIHHYRRQPQARSDVFRSVVIAHSEDDLQARPSAGSSLFPLYFSTSSDGRPPAQVFFFIYFSASSHGRLPAFDVLPAVDAACAAAKQLCIGARLCPSASVDVDWGCHQELRLCLENQRFSCGKIALGGEGRLEASSDETTIAMAKPPNEERKAPSRSTARRFRRRAT